VAKKDKTKQLETITIICFVFLYPIHVLATDVASEQLTRKL